MQILIPTLEVPIYEVTLFILFILSSFHLPHFIYFRWASFFKIELLHLHLMMKVSLVLFGFFYFKPQFFLSWKDGYLFFPLGILLGYFAVFLEKRAMRKEIRKSFLPMKKEQGSSKKVEIQNPFSHRPNEKKSFFQLHSFGKKNFIRMDWPTLLALAFLEELLFRGFLLSILLSFEIPFFLQLLAIFASIIIFALSHLLNGKGQMTSKLQFAFLVTFATILTHTLTTAVFAHLYLNYKAYLAYKESLRVV